MQHRLPCQNLSFASKPTSAIRPAFVIYSRSSIGVVLDEPKERSSTKASAGTANGASAGSARRDASAAVVEQVAALAIQARLAEHELVAFQVDSNLMSLVQGSIQGVAMHGLEWRSPMGLSARLLQVRVGEVAIDYPAVLSERRIKLRTMPTGSARCIFNAADFCNFLSHPFLTKAAEDHARRTGQPRLIFTGAPGSVTIIPPQRHDTSSPQHNSSTQGAAAASAGRQQNASPSSSNTPTGVDETSLRNGCVLFQATCMGQQFLLAMTPVSLHHRKSGTQSDATRNGSGHGQQQQQHMPGLHHHRNHQASHQLQLGQQGAQSSSQSQPHSSTAGGVGGLLVVAAPLHTSQGSNGSHQHRPSSAGPHNSAPTADNTSLPTQMTALIQQLEWKQSKLMAEAVLSVAGGLGAAVQGTQKAAAPASRATAAAGKVATSGAQRGPLSGGRSLSAATSHPKHTSSSTSVTVTGQAGGRTAMPAPPTSPAPSSMQPQNQQQGQNPSAEQVAESACQLFSSLMIDLQGAELSFAQLGIVSQAEAVAATDHVWATCGRSPRSRSAAMRSRGQGPGPGSAEQLSGGLIDLRLSVRVRDFPPLNLQF